MLAVSSFSAYTESLPLGRSLRAAHDCGEGRTLKVEHKENGFSAYCWRCSDHGWIPHPRLSLSEKIARLQQVRAVELKATASLSLPQPAEYDPQLWPHAPRVWLYKAGVSNDDIQALGFYWNERLHRVVMPIHEDGKLVYWQARGFDKASPKYINPIVSRDSLFAKFGTGPTLVLTEDVLSAYKVGKVTKAWAMLGTSFSDGMVMALAGAHSPVATLLDPDAGGDKGRRAATRQLPIMGISVTNLYPPRDPKLLSLKEIQSCLSNAGLPYR